MQITKNESNFKPQLQRMLREKLHDLSGCGYLQSLKAFADRLEVVVFSMRRYQFIKEDPGASVISGGHLGISVFDCSLMILISKGRREIFSLPAEPGEGVADGEYREQDEILSCHMC